MARAALGDPGVLPKGFMDRINTTGLKLKEATGHCRLTAVGQQVSVCFL